MHPFPSRELSLVAAVFACSSACFSLAVFAWSRAAMLAASGVSGARASLLSRALAAAELAQA